MVSIISLWLPILLSAVFVFLASSVIHMLLTYHFKDFKKAPNEDKLMDAIRNLNIPPGDYLVPCPSDPAERKAPAFQEKMKNGPSFLMTVWGSDAMSSMTQNLVLWFAYSIVIGIFSAYIAGRALAPGAHYLEVFRFVGFTAFTCYSVAKWQDSIWYKKSWGTTMRGTLDGLVYALLTAGTFGWLWPKM